VTDLPAVAGRDPTPLYQAVIGPKNANYYLAYFKRADERGYAPISWNWPSIFGPFWLLYRRLYQWALFYIGVSMLAYIVALALVAMGGGTWVVYVYLLVIGGFQLVYVPLHANAIYYRRAQREIEIARQLLPGQPNEQTKWLTARGGVSVGPPALLACVLLLMMSMQPPQPTGG
jgi:hypothetical protein